MWLYSILFVLHLNIESYNFNYDNILISTNKIYVWNMKILFIYDNRIYFFMSKRKTEEEARHFPFQFDLVLANKCLLLSLDSRRWNTISDYHILIKEIRIFKSNRSQHCRE